MIIVRRLFILALAAAGLASAPAHAGSGRGGHLDPRLSPSETSAGECVTRRVTGPGGAYRWERVECDSDRGGSDHDPWGYGRTPLSVETRDDRYGSADPGQDRYGPPPAAAAPDYVAAGRDRIGYLIWPGKRP